MDLRGKRFRFQGEQQNHIPVPQVRAALKLDEAIAHIAGKRLRAFDDFNVRDLDAARRRSLLAYARRCTGNPEVRDAGLPRALLNGHHRCLIPNALGAA